jgi:hypothetical protein
MEICEGTSGTEHDMTIMEPIHSKLLVKKKDGKIRLVQDYCPLNKWTKKN